MVVLSITYRPAELILSIEKFKSILEHKSVSKYYIGSETADEDSSVVNHYQCYVESEQLQTNMRKRLKKALAIEDVHALKVEVHNDPKYLLGYCQKEKREYITNIEEKELKAAEKYYSSKKTVIEESKGDRAPVFTAETIVQQVLKMHEKNNEEQYVHAYFVEFMKTYKAQISYSVYHKLNKADMRSYINLYLTESEAALEVENNNLT